MVVLVVRDEVRITSTAIRWLEQYLQELRANSSVLMLADVNSTVEQELRASGALDLIGRDNVFPASPRLMAAEQMAWEAAQTWLQQRPSADQITGSQSDAEA